MSVLSPEQYMDGTDAMLNSNGNLHLIVANGPRIRYSKKERGARLHPARVSLRTECSHIYGSVSSGMGRIKTEIYPLCGARKVSIVGYSNADNK